jgi:CRISPR type I-E-associated protein CasB/Cse2
MSTAVSRPGEKRYEQYSRYVRYIERISVKPGSRAALRSGLRRTPEQSPRMHAAVAGWVHESTRPAEERAFYTVAALIAGQPRAAREIDGRVREAADGSADQAQAETVGEVTPDVSTVRARPRSLGRSLADLQAKARSGRLDPDGDRQHQDAGRGTRDTDDPGATLTPMERRLHALCRLSLDGLHRQLPAIVLRLRSEQVPVDWAQLLDDMARWPWDRDRITKRWLQDYYRSAAAPVPNASPSPSEGVSQ